MIFKMDVCQSFFKIVNILCALLNIIIVYLLTDRCSKEIQKKNLKLIHKLKFN